MKVRNAVRWAYCNAAIFKHCKTPPFGDGFRLARSGSDCAAINRTENFMNSANKSNTQTDKKLHIRKNVAGGATGALIGAAVAGPVGAVVGGVVGTAVGAAAERNTTRQTRPASTRGSSTATSRRFKSSGLTGASRNGKNKQRQSSRSQGGSSARKAGVRGRAGRNSSKARRSR